MDNMAAVRLKQHAVILVKDAMDAARTPITYAATTENGAVVMELFVIRKTKVVAQKAVLFVRMVPTAIKATTAVSLKIKALHAVLRKVNVVTVGRGTAALMDGASVAKEVNGVVKMEISATCPIKGANMQIL